MKNKLTINSRQLAARSGKVTVDNKQLTIIGARIPCSYTLSIAVCRLSVLILLAIACSHNKDHASQSKYTCPMHPQIIQDKPGTCPICFMDLVKVGTTGDDGSIRLNGSQIKLANISTAPVVKKEMEIKTILNGKIAVDEEQTETISCRVVGRIEKLFFKEIGQQVVKGEPLYEIYSEQLLTLQQEFLMAQRQVEELNEKRYESFLRSSERKLLLFGMSKSQIDILSREKKTNSRITFLAPASGIIAKIDAREGQYVSEGSALYRIEKNNDVWVEAQLYSNEVSIARIGDEVKIQVNGFENSLVPGKIIFFSPELQQGNQIVTLRAQIDNPERRFIPGMQANVILSRSGRNAIVVPIDAVVRDNSGNRVWVQAGDGSFKMRMVTVGEETSDEIEIMDGVEEKENVVVTGAYLLYGELVLKKGSNQHQHM
jgi:Cu(I)/Ag(I) efflux system membrane fusion protein